METYKKILGILTFIFSLTGFGTLVFIITDGSTSNISIALFLFIPVFIILHYSIITKFGFENLLEKNSKIVLIGTLISLVLILIFPFRFGYEYYMKKNSEKSLNILKDWGDDINQTRGIKGNLRTKYESNQIFYQLYLKGFTESYSDIASLTIQLEDEALFIIEEIDIPFDGSVSMNGFERNDSLSLEIKGSAYFNQEDYQKIKKFELIGKKK